MQAGDAEDAEVSHTPSPPTDTPAGDLALAAKQYQAEAGGAAAPAAPQAGAAAAAPAVEPGSEQQQEQQPGAKKRPRIVAT